VGDCAGATHVRLEISNDPTFPIEDTWYTGAISESAKVMPRPLWDRLTPGYASGGYWRVVVGGADGATASEVRAFGVPD
jgi:hypothetical protein